MITQTRTEILPDHILSAILTLARRQANEERLVFRGHDYTLQEIFYALSRNPEYSLLQEFVFCESGPIPYSPALSDSVSKLQLSGLIGRENPDYERLFLNPAAEAFFDAVLAREFSPEARQQLEKIAADFYRRVTAS